MQAYLTSEASRIWSLSSAYEMAKNAIIDQGYAEEIAWQEGLRFQDVTETDFLRENAWVVLCSGMRETVVRSRFRAVSESFENWVSAKRIVEKRSHCRRKALCHFNHIAKIEAIIDTAERVAAQGFSKFKELIRSRPLSALQSLRFVGPITSYHLAKNLGLPLAKPDRHLVRWANAAGYSDVQVFCAEISRSTGDSVPVVDLVLWRFATIHPDYLEQFERHLDSSVMSLSCVDGL